MNKKVHVAPPVGAVFEHRYKGILYRLTVVKTEKGVGYEVDGETYTSPTLAAKAVTGQEHINGRKFWHIDDK